MQIGPNNREISAVPRDWIANSPIRITIVTVSTVFWSKNAAVAGIVCIPSTADSTDSAGVMIASP